jgi:hypothetical protein
MIRRHKWTQIVPAIVPALLLQTAIPIVHQIVTVLLRLTVPVQTLTLALALA